MKINLTLKLDSLNMPYLDIDPPYAGCSKLEVGQIMTVEVSEMDADPDLSEVEINE